MCNILINFYSVFMFQGLYFFVILSTIFYLEFDIDGDGTITKEVKIEVVLFIYFTDCRKRFLVYKRNNMNFLI